MHILLEGLDLAGKSTVCRLLRDHFGGSCSIRHNSLLAEGENTVYEMADRLRLGSAASDRATGHIYYAALLEDLDRFQPSADIVIHDSTILARSLAFHQSHCTPELPALFEALKPRHPRFDAAFYCRVTPATRLERLGMRRPQNLAADDFIFRDNPAVFQMMETVVSGIVTDFHGGVVISTDGDLKNDARCKSRLLDEILSHLPVS